MTSNTKLASELDKHKKETDEKFNTIVSMLKKKPTAQLTAENAPIVTSRAFSVTQKEETPTPVTEDQASAEASNYILNPAYQKIFDEYFDPADGFTGRLEGVYFTVVVPKKLSNASDAWKSFYKEDTRMKVLKHNRVEGDMREWCMMVARNLKYDRNVKLKI